MGRGRGRPDFGRGRVRPAASSPDARRRMESQAQRDTKPEIALRRELFRRGLRYRVHQRPVPGLRRTLDVVFPRARVAVDVRGCYWHSCPLHATQPQANAEWWAAKLEANRRRDNETEERLREAGWLPVVVWEHDHVMSAADNIQAAVRNRSNPRPVRSTNARGSAEKSRV